MQREDEPWRSETVGDAAASRGSGLLWAGGPDGPQAGKPDRDDVAEESVHQGDAHDPRRRERNDDEIHDDEDETAVQDGATP